jgi:nucleoid-associated protein YgaU
MLLKNSRYANAREFDSESSDFLGIRPRHIETAAGVIEHRVEVGQRLDLLARHYYNDSRLWWRILDANPDLLCGASMLLDEMAGEVILIPRVRG